MDGQIKMLHKEYVKSRKIQIPEDQFDYLARLYPALLVCMSDGVLDDEEWDGIVMVTRGLAAEFVKSPDDDRDMIAMSFRTEIRYLLDNIDKWRKKFLNALHHDLQGQDLDKEFVLETMYMFANIADGISDDEQDAINDISRRLDLKF